MEWKELGKELPDFDRPIEVRAFNNLGAVEFTPQVAKLIRTAKSNRFEKAGGLNVEGTIKYWRYLSEQ